MKKSNLISFALQSLIPLYFPYIFIGLAYGVLASQGGLPLYIVILSNIFIYAGAVQIVMLPLLASQASVFTIALMALFINARHLFYGIGFIEKFKNIGGVKYPYMAMTMTDETFSILTAITYPPEASTEDENQIDFYILSFAHIL